VGVGAYCLFCLFWSKIMTGSFFYFSMSSLTSFSRWQIGRFVVHPISIFEYPWQILVIGLLMGVIAVVPPLIAQLMSFRHSIAFVLAVYIFASIPAFAIVLLISSVAAACRPLRFRSRFIAIALCITPQCIYWAVFGGVSGVEPIKWGFSFAPWVCAWVVSLLLAGFVLGVGHFTRYKPGLVWSSSLAVLVATVLLFDFMVGFDELDYQLYIANNNPKEVEEFRSHSIKGALDETITNQEVLRYLAGFFYPTKDRIALRTSVKEKVLSQLRLDRWPSWLVLPDELDYQGERQRLNEKYNKFIKNRPKSKRMPIALYYKAMLSEMSPDIQRLADTEVLYFYSDYPRERSRQIWYRLYMEFPESTESIEARWRVAKHWAGMGMFEQASALAAEAQQMAQERLEQMRRDKNARETILWLFESPPETTITEFDLEQLWFRLAQLKELVSKENRGNDEQSARLANFIMLDPHAVDYSRKLDEMLRQMDESDPLRDNVLLEQIHIIPDEQLRAEKYLELHQQYKDTDGGIEALYNLARLKISLWRSREDYDAERKNEFLNEARATLGMFIEMYPDNFRTKPAEETLNKLPQN
jgi:hypothetical protein